MIFIYILIAIILYYSIYLKTKDRLNPIGLGVVTWLLLAAFASYPPLYDYSLQVELATETHIAIVIAAIFYAIPAVFSKRNYPKKLYNNWERSYLYFSQAYYIVINFVALLSVFTFFIRFSGSINDPALLSSANVSDLKLGLPKGIPVLHYFEYLTPCIALVFIFELKMNEVINKKRRLVILLYIFFTFVSLFLYKVSRDDALILLTGWVCIIYYTSMIKGKKIKFLRFLSVVAFSLIIVAALGLIRMSDESRVSTHFESANFVLFSQFYTYIAFNFQNLNSLVVSEFDHTGVWAVWRFILDYFYSGDYKYQFNIIDHQVLFFNAKTFIYYFYHDLGLFGVALYSFVIGFFVQLIYGALYRDLRFLIMLSFFIKPIMFMFFGNFFFVEFILFFPYIFSFLILFFIKPRVRIARV